MQKKPLTPEQKEDCRKLKAIFEAKKKHLGISQESIAHEIGITQGAVSQVFNGRNAITLKHAEAFSRILEVPVDEFSASLAAEINRLAQNVSSDTFEYAGKLKLGQTPVTGAAILGVDGMIEIMESHSGWLNIHSTDPKAYVIQIRGDSLWPRIKSGEFLVIEPTTTPEPGDEVLVTTVNGHQAIKQILYKKINEYQFISINQDGRPSTYSTEEIESVQFIAAIVKESRYSKA
ncbi:helix-turn-helix domain-containing protein [Serratia fonticola]|uniref:LexA family transcriptional regulator n=1 Tax=Serratia fonticola TaxID=47917 RepID=UPI002097F3DB|nr:XRE family transcriptional regulator [Serratia fonticola]MCO7512366.1 helix-turn-helix domain-containing protein [Serratia fonticola]